MFRGSCIAPWRISAYRASPDDADANVDGTHQRSPCVSTVAWHHLRQRCQWCYARHDSSPSPKHRQQQLPSIVSTACACSNPVSPPFDELLMQKFEPTFYGQVVLPQPRGVQCWSSMLGSSQFPHQSESSRLACSGAACARGVSQAARTTS